MLPPAQTVAGITLRPFTWGIMQLLQKHDNPFASGGESESAKDMAELVFAFCHDPEELLSITDDEWETEVNRFAFRLDIGTMNEISNHIKGQFELSSATSTTSMPGKRASKAKRRPG